MRNIAGLLSSSIKLFNEDFKFMLKSVYQHTENQKRNEINNFMNECVDDFLDNGSHKVHTQKNNPRFTRVLDS